MLPVLFHIGSYPVGSWGLLLMVAFVAGAVRAVVAAEKLYGVPRDPLWDASLYGLFGGVLGGRLAFVLLNPKQYLTHPGEVFAVWQGGMTSFGGLIGGVGVGLFIAKKRGLNVLDVCDAAGPSLAIGWFFGRIGCLLNGCCYGHVCTQPWAMEFHPKDGPITGRVHPTQLYDALGMALTFAFLTLVLEKRRAFRGQLLLVFLILFGVVRFVVEFWREQSGTESIIAGLSTGQWASIAVAAVALALWPAWSKTKL